MIGARRRFGLAAASIVLVLSGCSEPAPDADEQAPVAEPAAGASAEPSATAEPVVLDKIPEKLRGRWGLVANDCDTSRGDAHGALTVSADTLEFYESVARLGRIDSLSHVGIGADFDFSGEGEQWRSNMVLSVSPDGKTLTREDRGPDALPEPLTYMRCPE